MIDAILDFSIFGDYLTLGGVGFVVGVAAPIGFRLIGYVVDSVRITLKGVS